MRLFSILVLITLSFRANAQAPNDDCIDAINISDVTNYCSTYGAFNTFGTTPSIPSEYTCIPNDKTARDVWFKFTAEANFINLKVTGAAIGNDNGTLKNPQIILFSGPCSALVEIQCFSDAFDEHKVDAYAGPLTIGQEYYINVSARNDVTGSFQLCLNNYNLTYVPDGDCPTGKILCDKSSVFIANLLGTGDLNNEIPPGTCLNSENASSWYRWTCSKSGTLVIKLTPLKEEDDLDYALFELPGGLDDCANKKTLRCGAAGENVGAPKASWIQCTGPTGLNFTSGDLVEYPGCNDGNDSWVKYIDMVEGKSYAFIVNNSSPSGQGLFMDFGGTGEFLGARAAFDIEPEGTCFEDSLTFINLSTAPTDPIVSWNWNFGSNVNPSVFTDQNPPKIKYNTPGYKSINLTITSQDGCVHTINKTFIAKCCESPLEVELRALPSALVELGDFIDLKAITSNAFGQTTFEWIPADLIEDCFNCSEVNFRPAKDGIFYVKAQDEKGCITNDSLEIRIIDNFNVFAPNVFSPNYDGINDGFTIFPNPGAKSIKRLRVFNRWGACVYEGKDLTPGETSEGWDGTFKGQECNPDVYAFYAEVEFLNERIQVLKGSVTLVR